MDYGKALKIARAIKGIQQAEVAVKADLDPSYVCMLEKGKRKPSLGTIERLSSALGIPTHLFSLLATEEKDLKKADPKEIARVGESLARLILTHVPKDRKNGYRKSPDAQA
jgi:transcriptional regulator with XRE-family HTH domain